MPERFGSPRGRAPVLDLVGDCLALAPGEDRPLTVLLGPSGIGASETHAHVKRRYGPDVPCAYLNFEAREENLDVRAVLGALAQELGRRKKDYKEPCFPRLTVGLLATESPLDGRHPAQNRRQVAQTVHSTLHHRQRRGETWLGPLGEIAGALLGAPPGVSEAAAAALSSVSTKQSQLPRRQIHRGIAWYGDQRITGCEDPADALVGLNLRQHGGDAQGDRSDEVDRVLLSAFLDDLREHARGWLNHRSFLALLDNGHTAPGRHFLHLLLEQRRKDREQGRDCDPLVVLASVHRWLPAWGPATGDHWGLRPVQSDEASLRHWRRHRLGESTPEHWWYPVRLRELFLADTRAECAAAPLRSDVAPAVQRLTGGLPWAVRHTLDALTAAAPDPAQPCEDAYAALRRVPSLPLPASLPVPGADGAPARTLAEASLGILLEHLADAPGDRRPVLRHWAAARDLSVCGRVFPADDAGEPLFAGLRERWLLVPSGGAAQLHPWLRRLLLWELAEDADAWRRAHERLRDHFREHTAGREAEAAGLEVLYHRLALGDTREVAEDLARRFTAQDCEDWIRALDQVTSAPNRLDKSTPPLRLLDSLLSGEARGTRTLAGVVERIVVARWIWTDPLSDPGRRLNPVLADGFHQLATLRGGGVVPLYDEAARYQQWRDH